MGEEDKFNIHKIISYSAISLGVLVGIGLIYKKFSQEEKKLEPKKSNDFEIFAEEIVLPEEELEEEEYDTTICIIPLGDGHCLNFTKSKMKELKPKMISQIKSLSNLKPKV
jgi:hypothetical protein